MAQTTDWHTIQKIRGINIGHPPGDPTEDIEKIRDLVSPQKKRKETTGRTREFTGGTDRSE